LLARDLSCEIHLLVLTILLASLDLRVKFLLDLNVDSLKFLHFVHVELSAFDLEIILLLLGQLTIKVNLSAFIILSHFSNNFGSFLSDIILN